MRSSPSRVLRWPDRAAVEAAARTWAAAQALRHPELQRLGYFGSYARGDWGVGSDLDLVAIVRESSRRFPERGLDWHVEDLPVPAEILVYTRGEWKDMLAEGRGFAATVAREAVWLFELGEDPDRPPTH